MRCIRNDELIGTNFLCLDKTTNDKYKAQNCKSFYHFFKLPKRAFYRESYVQFAILPTEYGTARGDAIFVTSDRSNSFNVGGGASAQQVENAFRILLSDKHVRAVLINIFGGIMRCDIVASGVVEAARAIGVKVPVVVRLEGTNVEQGQEILRKSGLNFIVADGMKDAAEKVVAATR